jgi:NitT/TauT family transport system substrate-binding protein
VLKVPGSTSCVVALAAGLAAPAHAEVNELRIGKQYGLPYIQLVILEERKLIEKHARRMGLGDLVASRPSPTTGRTITSASSTP